MDSCQEVVVIIGAGRGFEDILKEMSDRPIFELLFDVFGGLLVWYAHYGYDRTYYLYGGHIGKLLNVAYVHQAGQKHGMVKCSTKSN